MDAIGLRRHVGRRSHIILDERLFCHQHLAIAEIDDGGGAILSQHDVGSLEVPMNEKIIHDGTISSDYFLKHIQSFTLAECTFVRNVLLQCAASALLHHNIAETPLLDHIICLHNIGAFDRPSRFLLALKQILSNLVVDLLHIDCLDGTGFP